jgi:hypothetical protein
VMLLPAATHNACSTFDASCQSKLESISALPQTQTTHICMPRHVLLILFYLAWVFECSFLSHPELHLQMQQVIYLSVEFKTKHSNCFLSNTTPPTTLAAVDAGIDAPCPSASILVPAWSTCTHSFSPSKPHPAQHSNCKFQYSSLKTCIGLLQNVQSCLSACTPAPYHRKEPWGEGGPAAGHQALHR